VAGARSPRQAASVLFAGKLQLQVALSGPCPVLLTLRKDRAKQYLTPFTSLASLF